MGSITKYKQALNESTQTKVKIMKTMNQKTTTLQHQQSTQSTTLYYKEGSSDKVYQCSIECKGDRYLVNFAFGRRGSTLQTGNKTPIGVPYEAAVNIYNKLVREIGRAHV